MFWNESVKQPPQSSVGGSPEAPLRGGGCSPDRIFTSGLGETLQVEKKKFSGSYEAELVNMPRSRLCVSSIHHR